MTSRRWLPVGAMGISVLLWSTAYVVSGEVLKTGSPAVLSVLRFVVGLLVLVPLSARRPGFLAALRNPRTLLLGLTGVTLYYSFSNIGLLFTSPGTVALTAALSPVLTTVIAFILLRERLSPRTIVGLVLVDARGDPGVDREAAVRSRDRAQHHRADLVRALHGAAAP